MRKAGKQGSMRAARATMHDVARAAGVGTTTVSRVINGELYVNGETAARVRAAITRLGYQPSQAARALKGEKTHCIGIIVPTLLDPFFAQIVMLVQKLVRERQMLLIVLASEDDATQMVRELKTFHSYHIDGLLIVPPSQLTRALVAAVKDLAVPTVTIDRPMTKHYSSVTCDNFEAARASVEHLIGHGCKSILCFGGTSKLYTIQERVRGYNKALDHASLKSHILTGMPKEAMKKALGEAFQNRQEKIDAIFSLYSEATIAAYEFLIASNYRIAQDVCLLGFDDFPLASTLAPAVSVMRQDIEAIGTAAAELLFREIEQSTVSITRASIASTLVVRSSCGVQARNGSS